MRDWPLVHGEGTRNASDHHPNLVKVYRSLFTLVGDNPAELQHWMRNPNLHLGGVPAERLCTVQGLVESVNYLDALRGRNWRITSSDPTEDSPRGGPKR